MSTTAKEGKKGKKGKGKGKVTMNLTDFLGQTNVPDGFDKKVVNWADAMEDDDLNEMPMPKFKDELKEVILPTAPKASRANEIDTSRVPTVPPFKAYIGNIPYGAGEEDLKKFFENLRPIAVQLPRDEKGTGRPRGFGYVEFETRDGLIEALKRNSAYLNDRPLKVSLPEDGSRETDRGGRDRGMMSSGDDDRTAGDWRKAPRPEQTMPQNQFSSSARPDMSREMSGPWRSSGNSAGPAADSRPGLRDRNGFDSSPYRSQEGFREPRYEAPRGDDRRTAGGAFSDRRPGAGFDNYTRPPPDERRFRDDRSFDSYHRDSYRDAPRQPPSRYQDDHDRRSGFSDRYDRGSSDFDRFDRSSAPRANDRSAPSDRPGEDSRQESTAAPQQEQLSQPPAPEAPKTRPKLNLQPRSKPLEEIAAPASAVTSKNIFGDAKPVDTTKKELEVEQKLKSLEVRDPSADPNTGRVRTISAGSGSNSTRSRKESETSERNVRDERRNENFGRDSDFGRREDRGPDRLYDNRDRRPAGYGSDRRVVDDRRRNDRGFQDRQQQNYNRRDDRRDDRPPPVRNSRPEDDRRYRNDSYRDNRDNNNGLKYENAKREIAPEYTMRNKYDALNDDEFESSTRPQARD